MKHISRVPSFRTKSVKCKYCPARFFSATDLIEHIKGNHPEDLLKEFGLIEDDSEAQ